jgi:soluble lytic murein transglycosylase-like protein
VSSVQDMVVAEAQRQGVDLNLALAVAQQESGFNPNAVSSAGAIGVFQLMPATAAQLGVNPYDAQKNIQGGITYLRQMLSMFGDPATALAAYNWGPGAVRNAQAAYGADWLSHAPAETQNYVARIMGSTSLPSAAPAAPSFAPSTSTLTIPPPAAPAFDWASAAIGLALVLGAGLVLSQ